MNASVGGTTHSRIVNEPVLPQMRLHLVGSLTITVDDRPLRLAARKGRAILAYLALNPRRAETRERLVGLFWSEFEEVKARASLRQIVREMRTVFHAAGSQGFGATRDGLMLASGSFSTDLDDVLYAVESEGSPHRLLLTTKALSEAILAGLDDVDPSFKFWVLAERRSIHDRLLSALEQLRTAPDKRDAEKLAVATCIFNLEPTNEDACRQLMRSLSSVGDVAGALGAFHRLQEVLSREYDIEPSRETRQIAAELKFDRFRTRLEVVPSVLLHAGAARSGKDRLASKSVLLLDPFEAYGLAEGQIRLIKGFRHHLLGSLAGFQRWSVVDGDCREATGTTDEHDAYYRLEGTAFPVRSRMSLMLTLKRGQDHVCRWSSRIEIDQETWFDAHRATVRGLATVLKVSRAPN